MIEADQKLLIDIAKESTGAYIHDSNMLSSNYKWFCMQGDTIGAEKAERLLRARLARIRLEKVKT